MCLSFPYMSASHSQSHRDIQHNPDHGFMQHFFVYALQKYLCWCLRAPKVLANTLYHKHTTSMLEAQEIHIPLFTI